MEDVLKVYPNANFVWMNRDILSQFSSIASLGPTIQGAASATRYDAEFRAESSEEALVLWSQVYKRGEELKKLVQKNGNSMVQIGFNDLIRDPIAQGKRL